MRAQVVFESMFGNTRDIAQAVADGLGADGAQVDLLEVGTAPEVVDPDVGLLVVGGPTQAFGMSRPGTRADAAKQATQPLVSPGIGVREWLERLQPVPGVAAATFDTRIKGTRVPGSAARGAHKRLHRLGFPMVAPAETFFVTATRGPLEPGEIDRAHAWGAELGRLAGPR